MGNHPGIDSFKRTGLTLIELLITIAVASILVGTVVLILKSSLDIHNVAQGGLILEKVLNESLIEITTGGFESYGIKDSLQILSATTRSITFVPLWFDDSHTIIEPTKPLILNRPFKPGASFPIAEISLPNSRKYKLVPITFVLGSHKSKRKPDDKIIVNESIPFGSKIRIVFQPDATYFPDAAMTIEWDAEAKVLREIYKDQSRTIPLGDIPGIVLKGAEFQYFDNTNTEISTDRNGRIPEELFPAVSAVKVTLEVATKLSSRKRSTFMNLRSSHSAGVGIIIQEGTRIKIPDSHNIRAFSLVNLVGVKEGGDIHIEARPKQGITWNIHVHLGIKNNKPMITEYIIMYPPGMRVYSEKVTLPTDLPLDFLTLDRNGLYDYDFDKGVINTVNLEGDVELVVTKMENVAGAALFIRP